ncbi:MAG: PDZ domain-containing protein [Vicinamibacterales bacterium]
MSDLGPAPKVLQAMRTKLVIAASSGLVLGAGALLKPQASSNVLQTPQEHSAPLLEEEAQRRAPLRAFAGLQDLGGRVAAHTVAIPPSAAPPPRSVLDFPIPARAATRPTGFGVIVSSQGDVLTHIDALGGRSTLDLQMLGGELMEARLAAFEPSTGLVLLRLSSTPRSLAGPVAAVAARAGSLAAAVGRWNGENIVAPVFVTGARDGVYYTSGAAAALPPGTPIFTLDGEVLAVVGTGGEPAVAYPAGEALGRLRADAAAGRGRPASLGILLQSMDERLSRAFAAKGVLVSDVIDGGAAAAAGVQAGDVLVAIADVPIISAETARRAIAAVVPASPVTTRVVRDGRPLTIDVVAGSAFTIASMVQPPAAVSDPLDAQPASPNVRGQAVVRPDPAPERQLRADALFTPTELIAADVPGAAQVLAINGEEAATRAAAVRRLGRRDAVTVLYLQHGGRRFFAAVAPRP